MKKIVVLFIVPILLIAVFILWVSRPKSDSLPQSVENTASSSLALAGAAINNSNNNQTTVNATIKTNLGDITVELYRDKSPKTVDNFVKLAQSDFYNGTLFHRVIKGFMIQGGDPLSKEADISRHGTGGPGYTFEDEINDVKLVRGVLAMANAGPNTNGSQFFIVTASETPWLDGHHTAFGRVTAGMEIVEKIENVKTGAGDHPVEDVKVLGVEVGE